MTKVQDIITVDMLEGEEQEIAPMYDPGAYGTVQRCLQGIKGEWEIPFPILTDWNQRINVEFYQETLLCLDSWFWMN